jgi:FkbM family methyltransferase
MRARKWLSAVRAAPEVLALKLSGHIGLGDVLHWARWLLSVRCLPPVEVLKRDDTDMTLLLRVSDTHFWWPCEFPQTRLGAVWAEVHRPWPVNGHAYELGGYALRGGQWVLDGGAGEGFFTGRALARGCNVAAVEPVPRLSYCLAKTYARDIREGRLKVMNLLLGRSEGSAYVDWETDPLLAHRNSTGTSVPVRTVDALVADGSIPRVDFLKLDIEGAELEALEGAERVIGRFHPILSIAVYHYPRQLSDVQDYLTNRFGPGLMAAKGLYWHGGSLTRQLLHVRWDR